MCCILLRKVLSHSMCECEFIILHLQMHLNFAVLKAILKFILMLSRIYTQNYFNIK